MIGSLASSREQPPTNVKEFVIRARKAPVDAARFLAAVGREGRVEYLAHMIVNALMVSKGHRPDTSITVVAEDSRDYSRALTFSGDLIGDLGGSHESAILGACAEALDAAAKLGKEQSVVSPRGVHVRTVSFEKLVREKTETATVFMLDRKGDDIREVDLAQPVTFLLTDHVPMPKKTFNSLARQGVRKVSLGPTMLHASQCISVIHNEMDRARV